MPQHTQNKKLELTYPCLWLYKIIGMDQEMIRQAVAETLCGRSCSITHSNSSKTGKYHCLNVEVLVHNQNDRTMIFHELKRHANIKMVL